LWEIIFFDFFSKYYCNKNAVNECRPRRLTGIQRYNLFEI
jgi:hypothetical protein